MNVWIANYMINLTSKRDCVGFSMGASVGDSMCIPIKHTVWKSVCEALTRPVFNCVDSPMKYSSRWPKAVFYEAN